MWCPATVLGKSEASYAGPCTIRLSFAAQAYNGERRVIGVRSREVVLNAGNIHCITRAQPPSLRHRPPLALFVANAVYGTCKDIPRLPAVCSGIRRLRS